MTRDNSQLGMKISAAAFETASEVRAVKIPVDPVRELQRLHDKNAEHLETRRLANSLMWWVNNSTSGADITMQEAACELHRLSDENRKLREQRDQLMNETNPARASNS